MSVKYLDVPLKSTKALTRTTLVDAAFVHNPMRLKPE